MGFACSRTFSGDEKIPSDADKIPTAVRVTAVAETAVIKPFLILLRSITTALYLRIVVYPPYFEKLRLLPPVISARLIFKII